MSAIALLATSLAIQARPSLSVDEKPLEVTLSAGRSDTYRLKLKAGEFVHLVAMQEGVDVILKVSAPDGKNLMSVDSPNGTQGPEIADFTAKQAGEYRVVVGMLDRKAAAGKYVLTATSARRFAFEVAEGNFASPRLKRLCGEVVTNPRAVSAFIASRKGKGPLMEDVPGDPADVYLSFFYNGDSTTRLVQLAGGPSPAGFRPMAQIPSTNLWAVTVLTPKDSRFIYSFAVDTDKKFGDAGSSSKFIDQSNVNDPLNPAKNFLGRSMLVLPDAPKRPYADTPAANPGKVTTYQISSKALKENRGYAVYTPPGFDATRATSYGVMMVFDGEAYGIGFGTVGAFVPTPTILDNLIAAGKIPPMMAILVRSQSTRGRDLPCSPTFVDFLVNELLPEIRRNYPAMSSDPKRMIAAGSSFGGVCSTYCALTHPEIFGNVLSQSGAYWVTGNDWQSRPPDFPQGEGMLLKAYLESPKLPVRFYMEVGTYESNALQLVPNRHLRDILKLKGYDLTYTEFHGNHDYEYWRGSLADGILNLTRDWSATP